MPETNGGESRALPESALAADVQSILAAIVESSDDAIYSKDEDARITSWNGSAEAMYGYRSDEVIGRDISIIIPDDRRGEDRMILRRIMNGERIDHYETRRRHKDGSLIDVSITVSPVRNINGEVVGASVIARDVTEQKEREELEQEIEKRDFIARAAHELKNPLTTIAGMTRILRDNEHDLPEDEKEKVYSALIRQSERANRLINDMLELARLDAGRVDVEIGRSDLSAAIAGAIDAVAIDGIAITSEVPSGTMVQANPSKLEDVFVNLFSNSQKYGASNVTVTAHGDLTIRVTDDGPGVPEVFRPVLFDPFTRGSQIDVPGSGLGLSIARRLCRIFGGDLSFEPAPGGGATFLVDLVRA